MTKPKDRAQGVAVMIVALGAAVYIAADLGFSGFEFIKKHSFFNAPTQQEPNSNARATNEIRNELLTISKTVTSKQSELEDLKAKLSSIKLEISTRLTELKKLAKLEARGNRELASIDDNRSEIENRADQIFQKFSQLSDIQAASTAWNIGEYVFETILENEGQESNKWQNFSLQNPFAPESAYLKPAGLRWAQIVSKSAKDLESKKIAVRFDKTNSANFDRAEVVRNYLAKLVGEKVSVKLEGTESNLLLSEAGVDVLIELKNQQGDQQ